ncbi:MAG: hypothetical protein AAF135_07715, partial [Bacteroidota bacterium]
SGREDNLDFLTEGAPGIRAIEKPTASSPARDIRIVLLNYILLLGRSSRQYVYLWQKDVIK